MPPPSRPGFPGRLARSPQIPQLPLIAQRIHRPPEAGVPEGPQLSVRRQSFEWLALPDRPIAIYILKHLAIEHEKSAVDPPPLVVRFLVKPRDRLIALDIEDPEPAPRRNGGHGCG